MTTAQGAQLALMAARVLEVKGALTETDKRNLAHIAEFGLKSFLGKLPKDCPDGVNPEHVRDYFNALKSLPDTLTAARTRPPHTTRPSP
jgi:hypothetical protein